MTELKQWPPIRYEWPDLKEKEVVLRDLYLKGIINSRSLFEAGLFHLEKNAGKDIRYIVYMSPGIYSHDDKNEEGVAGPLEAIQSAIEAQVDGGFRWYVWDKKQECGFSIDANTYIYAPLDAWAQHHYGPASFSKRSTKDLREIVQAATEVLNDREKRGVL